MCIFAKLAKPRKSFKSIFGKLDMINFISFNFAVIAVAVLTAGWYYAENKGFVNVVGDSYSGWLGILVDAMLLYFINWAIRREEKEKLIDQFGSESNAFALDATKRLRKKGWLLDGRLQGIDMLHARLDKANLIKAKLPQIDFSYASLKNANLVEADLTNCNLTGADLSGAVCRWGKFNGANLRWANLEGATLDGAIFDGADLRFAKLGNINKRTISFKGALLSESLSEKEIALVQKSAEPIRNATEEFSMSFYKELFKANPIVKTLFISNIKNQAVKFAQLLELLITSLDNMEKLMPALKALGKRHVNYGVNEQHYQIVGESLINTLQKSLGKQFTAEVKNAWLKTYGLVTMVMIDASKDLI